MRLGALRCICVHVLGQHPRQGALRALQHVDELLEVMLEGVVHIDEGIPNGGANEAIDFLEASGHALDPMQDGLLVLLIRGFGEAQINLQQSLGDGDRHVHVGGSFVQHPGLCAQDKALEASRLVEAFGDCGPLISRGYLEQAPDTLQGQSLSVDHHDGSEATVAHEGEVERGILDVGAELCVDLPLVVAERTNPVATVMQFLVQRLRMLAQGLGELTEWRGPTMAHEPCHSAGADEVSIRQPLRLGQGQDDVRADIVHVPILDELAEALVQRLKLLPIDGPPRASLRGHRVRCDGANLLPEMREPGFDRRP
mmetsp:Transcript_127467/g.366657  ORF Transcript_127467/g.366657 Transcript_127467/m.366657 type:complete len:312 (-) Transcript_127467:2360-3295(-)